MSFELYADMSRVEVDACVDSLADLPFGVHAVSFSEATMFHSSEILSPGEPFVKLFHVRARPSVVARFIA